MQEDNAAIAAAGFVLQMDCPDLAMSQPTGFSDFEKPFLKRAAFHVDALNHALAKIPATRSACTSCWGNYAGRIPTTSISARSRDRL